MFQEISRLTALFIQGSEEIEVTSGEGAKGKYRFYISTYHKTPLGFKRLHPLLVGVAEFATPDEAIAAGKRVVEKVKALDLTGGVKPDLRAERKAAYYCAQCEEPSDYVEDSDVLICPKCQTGRWLTQKRPGSKPESFDV